MEHGGFYLLKVQYDLCFPHLFSWAQERGGVGEECGSAPAHKCKEGRWAQGDEKRSGGSKASFQTTKQEASYQQTNLRMNLMLFYLAVAFQQLKVFRGRHSCLHQDCLF